MAFTSSRTVILCLVLLLVVHLQRASSQPIHGGNGIQVNYTAEALGGAYERRKFVLKKPNSNAAATAVARRKKRQPLASFPNPSDEGSSGPNLDPAASGGVWTRWKRLAAKTKSSPFRL
ncbi:hypothetical protein GPALN_012523 [Globodera pallida]|nr:hypothetical protein GPALN_012523 [Globodera pallida]